MEEMLRDIISQPQGKTQSSWEGTFERGFYFPMVGGEGSDSGGGGYVSSRNSPDVGHRLGVFYSSFLILLAHMNCFCNPPTVLSVPSLYPSNNLLVSLMISKHRAGLVTVEGV